MINKQGFGIIPAEIKKMEGCTLTQINKWRREKKNVNWDSISSVRPPAERSYSLDSGINEIQRLRKIWTGLMGNLQQIADEFPTELSQLRTILEERDLGHGGINSSSGVYEDTTGSSRSGMTKIKLSTPKAIHTEEEIEKINTEKEKSNKNL